jgi:GrpB-like predicted nucleotidyltransferase (UPF0157 family)
MTLIEIATSAESAESPAVVGQGGRQKRGGTAEGQPPYGGADPDHGRYVAADAEGESNEEEADHGGEDGAATCHVDHRRRTHGAYREDVRVSGSSEPRRPDVTAVELVGGVEALELTLHDYDDRWADTYLEHRARIANAVTAVDVEIEHIGSTSVPGLAAKPIIDIVVTVDDITAEEDYLDALLGAGYELRVREPGHRLVRTPARDVHVHLYEHDDPAVDEYLLLRDHLRSDADDRALYERTKRALTSKRWDDMNDYAAAKTDVILAIKARARQARRQ